MTLRFLKLAGLLLLIRAKNPSLVTWCVERMHPQLSVFLFLVAAVGGVGKRRGRRYLGLRRPPFHTKEVRSGIVRNRPMAAYAKAQAWEAVLEALWRFSMRR